MNQSRFFRILILFCLVLFQAGEVLAWGNDTLVPKGQNSLEMRGRVLKSEGQSRNDQKIPLDSAVVSVMNEAGKTIWSGITDAKGRMNVRLPFGKKFTMAFTKKGFVRKTISVDTHLSGDAKKNYDFTYDIDIFEKIEGLDVTVLDAPVAKIAYKTFDKSFTYDAAYTNKVNAGLQKMYREYYTLKKKDEQLAASDSVGSKAILIKSGGTKKSVPYGKSGKTHN